jgi:hypothetical protein
LLKQTFSGVEEPGVKAKGARSAPKKERNTFFLWGARKRGLKKGKAPNK